jgi:hypothetical protein
VLEVVERRLGELVVEGLGHLREANAPAAGRTRTR